jgi:hypothetical protein
MSGSSFPCLVYSSALKPEVACSFKMLEHDYQTARRHILEGSFIVTIMRTSLLPQLWVTYGVEVHGACGWQKFIPCHITSYCPPELWRWWTIYVWVLPEFSKGTAKKCVYNLTFKPCKTIFTNLKK